MSLKDRKISKAKRLTFQCKGTEIKLISQYKIEKVLPQISSLIKSEDKSGVWCETTDDKQNIIYSQGIPNAIQTVAYICRSKLGHD
jgi:hypothetical protein